MTLTIVKVKHQLKAFSPVLGYYLLLILVVENVGRDYSGLGVASYVSHRVINAFLVWRCSWGLPIIAVLVDKGELSRKLLGSNELVA